MNRLALPAALAALALVLGGCSSGSDEPVPAEASATPEPTTLAPGACVASAATRSVLGDVDVTEENVVDCDDQHVYEVVAVQDIPLEYLATPEPTEADRMLLADAIAGDDTLALQTKFRAWADTLCTIGVQRAVGLDDLELGGTKTAHLRALPYLRTAAPLAVLPEDGWTTQPLLVCVNRFTDDADNPADAPVAAVTGWTTPQLLSAELPTDRRTCFAFDAAGAVAPLGCDAPHYGELVLTFDATRLLDDEQLEVASQDPAVPFEPDVAETLDAACTDAMSRVVGEDYDADDLVARALRGPRGWGTGGTVNSVLCYVAAADDTAFDLPAGSVVGLGDADVELVPATA